MKRELTLYDLQKAVERAVVQMADHEELEYRAAKRYRTISLVLFALSLGLLALGFDTLVVLAGVAAGLSSLAWLVSWVAFSCAGKQLAFLDQALGDRKIYIGGEGREIRITTDIYDTPESHAMGEWLTSPLPDEISKDA